MRTREKVWLPPAHPQHQHVLGAVILRQIHPQAVADRSSRAGPPPSRNRHVAPDIGISQTVENLGDVVCIQIRDQRPLVGPDTVVFPARRQPIRDGAWR